MAGGEGGLEEAILEAVSRRGSLTEKGLRAEMATEELAMPFEVALERLVRDGLLVRKGKGRLVTPEAAGLVRGPLQGNRRGFAFVLRPDGEDLFVSARDLRGALHGDTVLARPTGKGREAVVVRVVSRANDRIMGILEKRGGVLFLTPLDPRLGTQVVVARKSVAAKEGDACTVRVTDFGDGQRPPVGTLVENLGSLDTPGVDVTVIVKRHDLPDVFSDEALREAEARALPVAPHDLRGRKDLRAMEIVTIDSADAKDLDDAVSVERLDGGWRLGVHIADVGHYVKETSHLDREAAERGTSVYLVDRVIPMLPEPISNGVASLLPAVERLALSVFITFDRSGKPVGTDMGPSVIKTRARLTYKGVNDALEGRAEGVYRDLQPLLRDMAELRDRLRERRLERGAVDFDLYEDRVKLGLHGRAEEIIRVYRTPADSLIEEFMLAANEAVARWAHKRKLPFLYRVHEPPDEDKVRTLKGFLRRFGLPAPFKEAPTPRALQRVLEAARGTADENLVSTVVLRSMMRARYAPEPLGHFGLAARDYTHFTSPIRRYPDLVIHRILKETWAHGEMTPKRRAFLEAWLPEVAKASSDAERRAEEAERESVDLKKVEFMTGRVGEEHEGIVTGVVPFGLFVEMDLGVEGLVPVATLPDDAYVHDEEIFSLVGRRTGRAFRLGDRVKVRVLAVHTRDRRVELELLPKEEPRPAVRVDTPERPSYNKKKRRRRRPRSAHEGHRR